MYVVTKRGIQANPKKVQTLCNMKSLSSLQETHRLIERVVALSRFVSRSINRGLLFFKVLKKITLFQWDNQCEQALQELKQYLAQLLLLAKLALREAL